MTGLFIKIIFHAWVQELRANELGFIENNILPTIKINIIQAKTKRKIFQCLIYKYIYLEFCWTKKFLETNRKTPQYSKGKR